MVKTVYRKMTVYDNIDYKFNKDIDMHRMEEMLKFDKKKTFE